MPKILRMIGRVLGLFLAFDWAGVALTLFTELIVLVDRLRETSALLGYVIWFVVGVFCGTCIYFSSEGEPDSPEGRRTGLTVLGVTAAVALLLGFLSALVWSTGESAELVAPDHRGVTLTYLVTAVSTVAGARFVLFREMPARVGAAPAVRVSPRYDRPKDLERALAPRREATTADPEAFRPAGFWGTIAFLFGVPVLLFFDVSFFVLGPFDVFDRWTDPLLTSSLVCGLLWGLAAARWEKPRSWLLVAHAPLLLGTVFYFFGLLPGALFAAFGAPEWLAGAAPLAGFALGFVLGLVALAGLVAERFGGSLTSARVNEATRDEAAREEAREETRP